jgi:hypothetical protein
VSAWSRVRHLFNGENMKLTREHSDDRYYKVGDVIRWIPAYATQKAYDARGLGIVVKAEGPIFEAYWTGEGMVRTADARPMSYNYILQDLKTVPKIKEYVEKVLEEYS